MEAAERKFLTDLAEFLGGDSRHFEKPGVHIVSCAERERPLPNGRIRACWIAWHQGAVLVSALPPLAGKLKKIIGNNSDHKALFAPAMLEQITAEHARYLADLRMHHGYSFVHCEKDLPYRETEPVLKLDASHQLALELFDDKAWEQLRSALGLGDVFGVVRDEELLALGHIALRGERAWAMDVRVDQGHRQKGHGRQVAEEVARHALTSGKVPYFTARHGDLGALRIGQALGFVKLTQEAWLTAHAK
jgi:GNAT superfamily N-acetyltransferase